MPEDDPDHYSKWFIENQPKQIYGDGGKQDYSDLGVKKKFLKMVKDETETTENKNMVGYFISEDELYPLQTFTGQPEFGIFQKESYNV